MVGSFGVYPKRLTNALEEVFNALPFRSFLLEG